MSQSEIQKLTEGPTEATSAIAVPQPGSTGVGSPPVIEAVVTPTQVRRPWRSTARTIFQAAVALATLLPFVLSDVYDSPDAYPAVVVQLLVVSGIVTRLMANPAVEEFLRRFLPFLAAAPNPTKANERGEIDVSLLLLIATFVLVALMFFGVHIKA